LGNDSYSLAALKGILFSKAPGMGQVIDISHDIRPFDIVEAAFVFSNAYGFFPKGTIHILAVNPFYGKNYQLLCLEHQGQYTIAPNHGILPLIFDQEINGSLVSLGDFHDTMGYYTLLGETVNRLIGGSSPEQIGETDPDLFLKINLKPVVSKNIIRGTIIHIDRFGNLVSNIKENAFERIRNDRDFAIYFRHKDPLTRIHKHYHEVPVGDELCLFSMSGNLEIAINMGNASEVLGLYLDDTIQIDFYE
jgi:S-adenosylmethionine hydrolase